MSYKHPLLLKIDWKGKIGYGDVISPICYAYTMAQKNCCDVQLSFHWPHNKTFKFKEEDPETLPQRTLFLHQIVKPILFHKVNIEHIYSSVIKYNHTNYDDKSPFHNHWFSRHRNFTSDKPFIALNTTRNHAQTLEDYGGDSKTWKDPVGEVKWAQAEKIIQDDWGLDVKHVDYSTPIHEAVDIYKKCLLAVGYHGSTIWIAKYLRAPMLIYSSKVQTSRSFPWATVQKKMEVTEFANLNPWQLRDRSLKRLAELDVQYEQYLNVPNLHSLRGRKT